MNRILIREMLSIYLEKPSVAFLIKLRISPNVVTLSGLVIACIGGASIGLGYFAVGATILLLSGLMDMFDGALARATNQDSSLGALLDSIVDRVSESVALLGLLAFYIYQTTGYEAVIGGMLSFIVMVSSILVSYVRARAEGLGIDCKVGILTRPERVVLLVTGLIMGEWWPLSTLVVLVAIALLASITVIQRILHIRTELTTMVH